MTAIAAIAALAALTACAQTEDGAPTPSGGEISADNPFGVEPGSVVEVVSLEGGYGNETVQYAAELVKERLGITATFATTSQVNQEFQPRFVAGDPPDLLTEGSGEHLPVTDMLDQLASFEELWNTPNYDGVKISDAVYPAVKSFGTVNGKFVRMPTTMTLFSLWYSKTLFEENGWEPPTTWDETMALCEKAKAKDKYLFTWGKEASSYWSWLAIDMAVKDAGLDVWRDIANLKEDAWSHPSVIASFEAIED
ncbi:MAG: extracellular solute-binding protein, partial [Bifidobacteriaceae bacterium]|nr:extracellular solute-binding protein [Bifidobacteriaceae bacterium]